MINCLIEAQLRSCRFKHTTGHPNYKLNFPNFLLLRKSAIDINETKETKSDSCSLIKMWTTLYLSLKDAL